MTACFGGAGVMLRCRLCSCVLAATGDLLEHQRGAQRVAFERTPSCSHWHVAKQEWMPVEGVGVEGTLYCPKCAGKVGHFNWAGMPCSCGSWVAPAFALQKGKVDAFK